MSNYVSVPQYLGAAVSTGSKARDDMTFYIEQLRNNLLDVHQFFAVEFMRSGESDAGMGGALSTTTTLLNRVDELAADFMATGDPVAATQIIMTSEKLMPVLYEMVGDRKYGWIENTKQLLSDMSETATQLPATIAQKVETIAVRTAGNIAMRAPLFSIIALVIGGAYLYKKIK